MAAAAASTKTRTPLGSASPAPHKPKPITYNPSSKMQADFEDLIYLRHRISGNLAKRFPKPRFSNPPSPRGMETFTA
jgi:hypothetical protein